MMGIVRWEFVVILLTFGPRYLAQVRTYDRVYQEQSQECNLSQKSSQPHRRECLFLGHRFEQNVTVKGLAQDYHE